MIYTISRGCEFFPVQLLIYEHRFDPVYSLGEPERSIKSVTYDSMQHLPWESDPGHGIHAKMVDPLTKLFAKEWPRYDPYWLIKRWMIFRLPENARNVFYAVYHTEYTMTKDFGEL